MALSAATASLHLAALHDDDEDGDEYCFYGNREEHVTERWSSRAIDKGSPLSWPKYRSRSVTTGSGHDGTRLCFPCRFTRHSNYQQFKKSCDLCSMIWDAFFSQPHRMILDQKRYRFILLESSKRLGLIEAHVRDQYSVKTVGTPVNVFRGPTKPPRTPTLVSQTEQALAAQDILRPRLRDLDCQTSLLKSWLALCGLQHDARCRKPHSSPRPNLRLIDTQDECIVAVGSNNWQPEHYVALSYCCGNQEQLRSRTAGSYSGLARKGALLHMPLPQTISDAMMLVKRLGLRYLWVDALCIRQDNEADKREQILQIGFVYESAMFTIVAASGKDSDAGLPGVRPNTRFRQQYGVRIGGETYIASIQNPVDEIYTSKTSKWARRAWTFQEELLSPRRLIFTDEQVWWQCQCATWCEQLQLEITDPKSFPFGAQTVTKPLKRQASELSPQYYEDLVTNYAPRELSYPSDVFNAFAGVLSMVKTRFNEGFLWGLMTSTFERHLFWTGRSKERVLLRQKPFPSWSWMAWIGSVSFEITYTYSPEIVCYVIGKDEVVSKCNQILGRNSEALRAQINNLSLDEHLTVSIEDILSTYPNSMLQRGFHLFFWTYSAKLYLTFEGRVTLPSAVHWTVKFEDTNSMQQLPASSPDYGYLLPTLDYRDTCKSSPCECILLARASGIGTYNAPYVLLMLITRRDGIVYRRGIANMPESIWHRADKTWELIALG